MLRFQLAALTRCSELGRRSGSVGSIERRVSLHRLALRYQVLFGEEFVQFVDQGTLGGILYSADLLDEAASVDGLDLIENNESGLI